MRILTILFALIFTLPCFSQIVRGVTYTEEEIAIQDKFVEAKKFTLIGRFEKAEEILKKLYNEDRKNPAVALELSKVYGYMEDPYNEFRFAKTALDNSEGNEFVKINYANICFDQEKYDDAIPALEELVMANKSSEEFTDKLATAYLEINNADGALKAYDNLESQIGVTENVSRRKFEIYEILGENKNALKELEQLSAAFPTEVRFKHNLAAFYLKMGKDDEALDVYRQILELDINDAKANMAITAADAGGGDDNTYLRSLTPIIENKSIPVDRKILELVPYVDQLNQKYDQELADALIMLSDKITIIHPKEAKSYSLYGDVLMSAGRAKDASKAYEKTLNLNDRIYTVWEGLMEAYSEMKDEINLLRVATEALDFFPNKASAYMYYGRANTMNKDFVEAIDLLNEGLFVSGKDLYHKSNIHAELARAHAANKNLDFADQNITKALEISQNQNPLALEIKGDILFLKGETDSAVEYWKKAQEAGIRSINLSEKIEQKKL